MDMILVERRFQTGDKLPNELQLAQELGISRVTLRDGLEIEQAVEQPKRRKFA